MTYYDTFVAGTKIKASEVNSNFLLAGSVEGLKLTLALNDLNQLGNLSKSYDLQSVYLNIDDIDLFATTTNLTDANNGVYSVTDGAYEAETGDINFSKSTTDYFVYVDYNIFNDLRDSDLLASKAGSTGSVEAVDTNNIVNKKVVWISFNLTAGDPGSTAYIQLDDGTSNRVTLISKAGSNTVTSGILKLHLDIANDRVYLTRSYRYRNNNTDTNEEVVDSDYIDISSLTTGNYYVRALAENNSTGTTSANAHYIRASKATESTTVNITASGDGGTTDDTVTNGSVVTLTSASTKCSVKIAGTIATDEGIEINSISLKQV